MNLIKLNIVGLRYSQFTSGAYLLLLEEDNGIKRLSIVIGQCESQAIAIGLDSTIVSPRPLTHDLFTSIAEKTNILLEKVVIHKLEKGIFFSSIIFLEKKSNQNFIIDSRTSDAIAIAIRFNAPIYTYKKILEKANNSLEDADLSDEVYSKTKEVEKKELVNIESLEKKLHLAIQNEDYELAAKIRDQIKKLND